MVNFDPFLAEWKLFANDEHYGIVEKSLKMAQLVEYPDLDITKYVKNIAQLRESFRLDLGTNLDVPTKIAELGIYFFGVCGFRGDFDDHYNPRNNFLNDVIDRRSGIAITISIIYAEIGKGAGLEMRLIGFPGRALVGCGDNIIDPLVGARILQKEDLCNILELNGITSTDLHPELLAQASTEKLLICMARNLKHSYMHSFAYDKALLCTQIALALSDSSVMDLRDAGLLKARLQDRNGALEDLNQYLEMNPNGEDVDHVIEIMHQIRSNQV